MPKAAPSFGDASSSWPTLGVLLGVCVAALGCAKGPAVGAEQQSPATPVQIREVREISVDDSIEDVAVVKSRDSTAIMPEVEGKITQIYVQSGDSVAPGTPVMEIDAAKQSAALKSQENARAAQEASVLWLKQQDERARALHSAGVLSNQDLEQARYAYETARAQLEALDAQVREQQVQLRYYKVEAPRSGMIGDIPVHVGDRVVTSTVLTTVDAPGKLEVYIYVPVARSAKVGMKMPVQVIDADHKVVANGSVYFISPVVDSSTQTVLVKAQITGTRANLRASQFIRARLLHPNAAKATVVPVLAVTHLGGQSFVFVAEKDDKGSYAARQKPVQLGGITGDDYLVLGGIKPGDKVIISGTQFLSEGAPVVAQEGGG